MNDFNIDVVHSFCISFMFTYIFISSYEKLIELFLLSTNTYYYLASSGLIPPELNGIFNYVSACIFSELYLHRILNNENLYLYLIEWVKINCTDLNSFVNNNFDQKFKADIFCFLNQLKNNCEMSVFKGSSISGQSLKALIDYIRQNQV